MKKNDWILIGVVIAAAIIGFFTLWRTGSAEAGYVMVKVNGKEAGTYSLGKDQTVDIRDINTLVIVDGEARMEDAKCTDKICVNHKPVSKKGESIICLPNKVIIEVIKGETGELDAVAN